MQEIKNKRKQFNIKSYLYILLMFVGVVFVVTGLSESVFLIIGILSIAGAKLIMKSYLKNENEKDRKQIKKFFIRQGCFIFLCTTVILAPIGISIKNKGGEMFNYYKNNFVLENFKSSIQRKDELDIMFFLDLENEYAVD